MKNFLLVILILFVTVPFAFAQAHMETTLDTPQALTAPVTKMSLKAFIWNTDSFEALYEFKDANGVLVASKKCLIKDWEEIITPESCSIPEYRRKKQCEAKGGTWTPAVTVQHNDFSTGANAVIGAGAVGKTYKSAIVGYLQNKCKDMWSITGTEN